MFGSRFGFSIKRNFVQLNKDHQRFRNDAISFVMRLAKPRNTPSFSALRSRAKLMINRLRIFENTGTPIASPLQLAQLFDRKVETHEDSARTL
jgi:hypothetical protein